MDYNEQEQKYTRLRGDGFAATMKDGLIEICQDMPDGLSVIVLIPDEARDLVQALEGFLKIVKDEG